MATGNLDMASPVLKKSYDIFISYATPDGDTALKICKFLEDRGLHCWIAARNIGGGNEYGTAIIEGIRSSSLMIVLLSKYSNASHHVRNEVERAFNHQLSIIPFRMSNVVPHQALEYFLSSAQWVDASEGFVGDHYEKLYENACQLLQKSAVVTTRPRTRTQRTKSIAAIVAAVCVMLVIYFAFFNGGGRKKMGPFDGRFPEASQRLLADSDLNGKTTCDLLIMRNEIFARHGYIFHRPGLKAYFESQGWYKPVPSFVIEALSPVEKLNATIILNAEKKNEIAGNACNDFASF